MDAYNLFLDKKSRIVGSSGIIVDESNINPILFDFQKSIVKWALLKGRAAIFADCGLGKTFMQIEWARLVGGTGLIVCPLCVAQQTIKEGAKLNVLINFAKNKNQIKPGINITNYEMIEHFDGNLDFIVLDESSILKSIGGKTKNKLMEIFKGLKFKLCCTATPAPNDQAELGNHSEFLGALTYVEMLATYFVHKDTEWRLKGHAKDAFYKWMASWAICIKNPSDFGFDGSDFILPELNINHISVNTNFTRPGELFSTSLHGIQDRTLVRKNTISDRVKAAINLINGGSEQWICWCGLNDEANQLKRALGDKAVNVEGNDTAEEKEKSINAFLNNDIRVLVTKPKICGFGMNFQNTANMLFMGLSDSYESYYQCIRRSWRYGQKNKVNVYIVLSDIESDIFKNVLEKESKANEMSTGMLNNILEFERVELGVISKEDFSMEIEKQSGNGWEMINGDCVEETSKLAENHIDFSIYSPPFISLYTYTATARDIGNSKNEDEFFEHYQFLVQNLLRITKPGRLTAVHVSQVPAMLVRDGYIGMKDFRGRCVREYERGGWIYQGEIVIQKNPQSQAVRTKAKGLMFATLKRDSSWLRPGLADYICLFRKPGDNQIPIQPNDISHNDWIEWAHPVWFNIRENHTLNKNCARTEKDERHICPLQLDVIERCIKLWSNPDELVFSPFAGIGSEGYQALRYGRRFLGIELKPEYYKIAINNLKEARIINSGLFSEAV